MSKRRVVITGLGIVSPVGNDINSAWGNILAGKSGIGPITNFDATDFPRHSLYHCQQEKPEMSNIDERVKKIVIEQLGVKEDEVSNSSSFVDDLGADSLDTVELVMALEEEFECEIPDEEAEKITTVQQAIDYVSAHLG